MKNQEQYIVSLTSYPERIECCIKTIQSLLEQNTDVDYSIVLTLAEPQFPDKTMSEELNKLIQERKVELLWHPTGIRSHKKLMLILKKYPAATVIITDDDVKRPEWWLQMFIDEHKKYLKDVIVGESAWKLGTDFKQTTENLLRNMKL